MTVGWSWVGTPHASTSTSVPVYAASVPAGDAIFCSILSKATSGTGDPPTFTANSGWTEVHSAAGGTGTAGADAGRCRTTVWRRDADAAGTEGSTTINITVTPSSFMFSTLFGLTHSTAMSIVAASGEDTSAGAAFSVTPGSDPGITNADFLVAIAGWTVSTSSAASAETITSPSATIGTVTERWDTSTTSGNDGRIVGWSAACTAGTSTGAPTIGATSAAATQTGVGTIIRFRESAGAVTNSLRTVGGRGMMQAIYPTVSG